MKSGYLLVRHVPYVDGNKQVRFGILVCSLNLAGDMAAAPDDHTIFFGGAAPCDANGNGLNIMAGSARQTMAEVEVDHRFSCKPGPTGKYSDYYAKITTYVGVLGGPALALDPSSTATTFKAIAAAEEESVFHYLDTASSRVGIESLSAKLAVRKVAIVGVGGTGAYVLDLVAKTPVGEIHLFDGDVFFQHNAFRAPGAASVAELTEQPKKVHYYAARYSKMHRHVVPHDYYLDDGNAGELSDMDFVFLCVDGTPAKKALINALQLCSVPFVDVGMGIIMVDGCLTGLLRVTTSTCEKHNHVHDRIGFLTNDDAHEYERNIQVADLNALNAALAVVKWKKHCKFYADIEGEHQTAYSIDSNLLTNDDYA